MKQFGLPFVIVGLASCFYVYEFAIRVMPSAMTTELMSSYDIGARGLGIMASLFYYGYSPMQIPAGLLCDRFGPRVLMTVTMAMCAAATFVFAYTDSIVLAGAARWMTGFASSFAFVGALVLASRWYPAKYFAFIVGLIQMMGSVGAIAGEKPFAWLITIIGWRQTVLYTGCVGVVLAVLFWLLIRDHPEKVSREQPRKAASNEWQRLKKVLRRKQTWWVGLYAFSSWAPISVFAALWGVPFMMTLYHTTTTSAAEAISMIWIGVAVSSPLIGWWSNVIGRRTMLLVLCSSVGLVASVLILYGPTMPWFLMFSLLFLFGFAASGQSLSFGVVQDNNPPDVAGTAVGFNNMSVVMGGVLFQPLVGIILRAEWTGQMHLSVPVYSLSNYHIALLVIPVCYILGLLTSVFFIKETRCLPQY